MFNPWGQCFPRAPISILVIHIPAHRAYIPYAGLVIVFYMTDYNRLSNLMCILNCSICKRFPVMVFSHPSLQPQTPLVSLWTWLRVWFLYWTELIFVHDNKCSLVRYQHTLLFPFTTSDVGKIRFCCQIVNLMISFLSLVQISANSVSFSVKLGLGASCTSDCVMFDKYKCNRTAAYLQCCYLYCIHLGQRKKTSFKWENLQCNVIKKFIVWV